jgi:hypothetical protein
MFLYSRSAIFVALCKFCLHNCLMQSSSTLIARRSLDVNGLNSLYRELFSVPAKQPKRKAVSHEYSRVTELTESGLALNVSTVDCWEMRAAADFWLASILVLAAAACLDFALMI